MSSPELGASPVAPPVPAERGIGRDAAWTALTFAVTTATYFPLLAYIVRRIGPAEFGLFTIVTSVTALLLVAEFSLGTAVVRSTAIDEAARSDEPDAGRAEVLDAHAALMVLGALAAAVVVPLSLLLPALVQVPPGKGTEFVASTVVIGLATAAALATAALPAVARGRRRFALVAGCTIAGVVTRSLLVVALLGHFRLMALAVAHAAAVVVERGLEALWVRRAVPWFRFAPRRLDLGAVRRTGSFALPLVVLSIDAQLVASSDAVVIGAIVGAGGVALYRIGSAVPRQAAGALLTGFSASFPSLASMTEPGQQTELMRFLTRVEGFLAGAAFGVVALFRADIVLLLLGRRSGTAEAVLLAFSATYAFDIGVHSMVLVLIARGRQWVMAVLSPVQLTVNLVATILLVRAMGPEGAAVAALLTFGLVDLVLFPITARREFTPSAARIVFGDAVVSAALGAAVATAAAWPASIGLAPSFGRVAAGSAAAALAGTAAGLVLLGGDGRARLLAAVRR